MGRLLSLETGKSKRRKNNKQFDLAKESITYLNRDFQQQQKEALLEASAKIANAHYIVTDNTTAHPRKLYGSN